jgi:hypothetical protein
MTRHADARQQCSPLGPLNAIARELSEVQLRVLLHLAWLCEQDTSAAASTREIAAATGASRRNVQLAVKFLEETKCLISRIPGTAIKPARYSVHLPQQFPQLRESGAAATPPGGSLQTPLWQPGDATPGAAADPRGGAAMTPRTAEINQLPQTAASVDEIDYENQRRVLDRAHARRPEKPNPEDLKEVRRWVHGYQLKFGKVPEAHAPDDDIMARMLAIATAAQLINLVYELMAERKEPGTNYGWYLTVALQRLHGIPPATQKRHRDQMRLMRSAGRQATAAANLASKEEVDELKLEIAALADRMHLAPQQRRRA